jgi:tryptophan halogenase
MAQFNGAGTTLGYIMLLKNIIIVGGGFAGWYTAAAFRHNFPDCDVTVIDSEKHGRMGVGETLGFSSPHDFKNLLGITDDQKLMRSSGSIYKYGIKQTDFMQPQSVHPMTKLYNTKVKSLTNFYNEFDWTDFCEPWNQQPGDVGLLSAWMTINQYNDKNFLDFIDEVGEGTHFILNPSAPCKDNQYALRQQEGWSYHIDAEQTVRFLKDLSLTSEHITHVSNTIVDVKLNETGIDCLLFEDGTEIKGDLYLDCSGFARVLMKRLPDAYWIDQGEEYNNSAWVCPSAYTDPEREMIGATYTYGDEHGWRFQLNLYHRRGNGYIFNSRMTNPDLPLQRLLELTEGTRFVDPRLVTWNPGHYDKPWVNNVIGLGISSHFIDPHDAPSFDIHSRSLESLINAAKSPTVDTAQEYFNRVQSLAVEERELRLMFNFGLSKRSGYWWDSRREMARKNDYFQELHNIVSHKRTDIESRLQHFWHNMYYRMILTSETDRTQFSFPHLTDQDRAMAESFFAYNRQRNKYISQQAWPNNYRWLQANRFDGLTSQEVLEELHPNFV